MFLRVWPAKVAKSSRGGGRSALAVVIMAHMLLTTVYFKFDDPRCSGSTKFQQNPEKRM
jgi:hypothetical protein